MSVSFQIPALSTHQVGTGTGAIKENRTAVVPVETALVAVTASVKTFAPVMKNHHMYARPAQIVVHAACKKWNTMRNWHRRHTKHSAPNPAKAFPFQKKNCPTLIPLFLLKSSAARPFLLSGIHTKGKCLYRIAPSILISTAVSWMRITLIFAASSECLPERKAGRY